MLVPVDVRAPDAEDDEFATSRESFMLVREGPFSERQVSKQLLQGGHLLVPTVPCGVSRCYRRVLGASCGGLQYDRFSQCSVVMTHVSKHAHGSVDGLEDSENKKIDWRAVGAGLRHYSRA